MNKKVFILLLMLALMLTGCSGGSDEVLRLASTEVPYTLDPCEKFSGTYLRYCGAAEALTKVDPEGAIQMELAESIDQLDDSSWEITLRDGVEFWSGQVLDAKTLVGSILRYMEINPDGASQLEGISMEALDDTKVLVKAQSTGIDLPLILTNVYITNPSAEYTSVETTDLTGMYKVTEYIPKERIELVANDNYWGDAPKIPKITWYEMADPDARKMAAINKDIDIVRRIEPTQVKDLEDSGNVNVYNVPSSSTLAIYLNLSKAPFNDVNVRQAINWALDRDEISLLATEGMSEPTTTWLGTNPLFQSERHILYSQDKDKVRELLTESGWTLGDDGIYEKDGEKLEIKLYTWGNDKLMGEAIQSQLMDQGISVDLNHVDYSIIQAARESGDWDGSIEAWDTWGDPYPVMYGHFGVDGSANYGGYDSPVVNQALEELKNTKDPDRQHQLMSIINQEAAVDSCIVSLMPRPAIYSVNKDLEGFVPHFMNYQYMVNSDMEFR